MEEGWVYIIHFCAIHSSGDLTNSCFPHSLAASISIKSIHVSTSMFAYSVSSGVHMQLNLSLQFLLIVLIHCVLNVLESIKEFFRTFDPKLTSCTSAEVQNCSCLDINVNTSYTFTRYLMIWYLMVVVGDGGGAAVEVNGLKHTKPTTMDLWAPPWTSVLILAALCVCVCIKGKVLRLTLMSCLLEYDCILPRGEEFEVGAVGFCR